jgi:hypothetical protein
LTTIDRLLEKAIRAAEANRPAEALALLKQIVQLDPRNERAWLWLTQVVETDEQRVVCLKNVLAINPDNKAAHQGLSVLAGRPATARAPLERAEPREPSRDMQTMVNLAEPVATPPTEASASPGAHPPGERPLALDASAAGSRRGPPSRVTWSLLGATGAALLLLLACLLSYTAGLIALPGDALFPGPVPTQPPEPTLTAAPTPDLNVFYMTCCEHVTNRLDQLLHDIKSGTASALYAQDTDVFCAKQVAWPRTISELTAAHADCPLPADEHLLLARENTDKALAELAQAASCWTDYCSTRDLARMEDSLTHLDQASVYYVRGSRQFEEYALGGE